MSAEKEGKRIDREEAHVTLSVAAALAFHQTYGTTKAINSVEDYDSALNLSATVLSRMATIYSLDVKTNERVPIDAKEMKLRTFFRGATELRREGKPPIFS